MSGLRMVSQPAALCGSKKEITFPSQRVRKQILARAVSVNGQDSQNEKRTTNTSRNSIILDDIDRIFQLQA